MAAQERPTRSTLARASPANLAVSPALPPEPPRYAQASRASQVLIWPARDPLRRQAQAPEYEPAEHRSRPVPACPSPRLDRPKRVWHRRAVRSPVQPAFRSRPASMPARRARRPYPDARTASRQRRQAWPRRRPRPRSTRTNMSGLAASTELEASWPRAGGSDPASPGRFVIVGGEEPAFGPSAPG